MKKTVLISLLAIVTTTFSFAQKEFQGMAVYESKTSTSDFNNQFGNNREFTPEMRTRMEERMKTMFEKTFTLNFDKTTSIYKEEEKLEAPGQGGGFRMMGSMMGSGGTYFKNIKDKNYVVDKEFFGKEFLIKDTLTTYKWKMESESRQIGGYTCYKATAKIPASKTDFRNFRPKQESTATETDTTKAKKEKSTNFMDNFELPTEITITAWYTPEVPISQGPEGYWGLPGLILEVNDGKTTILCSKLILNTKDKAEIKASTNGKVVSQKEYDDTVTKKMEEFREMRRNQGGNDRFHMRIGN